ncbi:hypothetical protein LCI18_011274 [Fusarium solani-melongenae]|uniref:Uncharacterized protein n=1 Tax=Fusarium solani subsp. cucurbitae TaxID=2747967 RepID=A0ACD3ZGC9_FUSSC|nr:hypothetical protein LCI18_011274 [Fusarium solani-melongenae]
MAGSRIIAPEEWESLKTVISDLYLNQKMTLAEVMRLMEDEHGFQASKAQYVRKLKNWGMEKNSTNQKWKVAAQQVQKRKLEGKETEILINGRLVPWKKLRKATARYTGSQSDRIEGSEWEHSMGFYSDPGNESLPSIPNNELDLLLGWDPSLANEEQSQSSSLLDPSCREARRLLGECLGETIDPDNPDYSSRISSSLEELTIDRHDGDLVHHVKRLSAASGQEAVFQLLRYTVYLSSNNLLSEMKTDKILRWIIDSGHLWTLESLLGSTLPTTKIFASNLLVSAARLEEVSMVKALLAKGFDPNTLAGMLEKKTPIEVAANQGNVTLVKVLLDAKANPNVHQDIHPASETALQSAISGHRKNSVIAKMLIDGGADVNAVGGDWDHPTTMLNLAARYGDPDLVQMLLDAGARVNEMPVCEGTALQIAVSRGDIDITEILIAAGADVNCPIGKAYQDACELAAEKNWPDVLATPIQRAASEDNMEMIQVLLGAGADIHGFPAREVFPWLISSGKLSEREDKQEEEHWCDDWDHLHISCALRPALMSAVARKNVVLVRMLLNLGADVNARGCGGTALQLASAQRNVKLVQLLLKKGANVNSGVQDAKRGKTALQAAARSGDGDVVECLLKAGAQVNALPSSYEGRTAVQAAVESQNIDLVKLLVNAGADINAAPAPKDGRTCLQVAAASGNVEMVELLLQLGADVNSPASSEWGGRTPLQAAIESGHERVSAMLIERGANLNLPSSFEDGYSALGFAIVNRNHDLVHSLLAGGADPNGFGGKQTPLGIATSQYNLDMVYCLLDAGADVNRTHEGQTPLELAVKGGRLDIARAILRAKPTIGGHVGVEVLRWAVLRNSLKMVELLLSHGVSVNKPLGVKHDSPLLEAVSRWYINNEDFVRTLLSHHVDVNSDHGKPLQVAAARGSIWTVQALLKAGANVNSPALGLQSKTALQGAAASGKTELVDILLEAGADINAPPSTEWGETALQAAVAQGSVRMVKFLLLHGADVNAPASPYHGATALQKAAIAGHLRIALMLLKEGADINAPPAVTGGRTALEAAAEHERLDLTCLLLRNDTELENFERRRNRAAKLASSAGNHILANVLREWKRD